MSQELLNKLYDAYDYLYICDQYRDLIQRFENDTENCKKKYLRIKNEKVSVAPIYLMICFASVVALMIGGLTASQIGSSLIVYLILAAIVAAFILANKHAKRQKTMPEQKAMEFWKTIGSPTCVENDAKIKKIDEEFLNFRVANDCVLDFLPEDYQDDISAVSYMAHVIKNGLAESQKEALHLYIEQRHRWEVEATMHGMAQSMELHNREMESYMAEMSFQQRITNSRLANIETLTFLDYINH